MAKTSLASVICGTEILLSSEYVSINQGDVIGTHFPSTNPLSMLAANASGHSLKEHNGSETVTVINSTELNDAIEYALHVSADISE